MRKFTAEVKRPVGITYPSDLSYGGIDKGFHFMQIQRPVYYKNEQGEETNSMSHYMFGEIRFLDEDATIENMKLMVEMGLTR